MKNLLVALTLVLSTATVSASNTNIKFVSTDNSIESDLCIVAAKLGFKAAMKLTSDKLARRTTCNGQDIKHFSKTYQFKDVTAPKAVVVVPVNNSAESKVCAQAVKIGIKAAASLVNFNVKHMTCNGKNLRSFVKQYSNT
ncbi:MAG: hypothetical protein ACI9LM_004693 [Alteromonadaceae bacterium]|jgi:hypothetical protein